MGHFYGKGPWEFNEVPVEELVLWYEEAVRLYNKMNPAPDG